MPNPPLPNSYWVVPGRLLAGEYPYAPSHAAGRTVYVHCFGGKGRTGPLVALHLIEQGMTAEEAIDRITALRKSTRDSWVECPEMPGQVAFVRRWKKPGA